VRGQDGAHRHLALRQIGKRASRLLPRQ
jgi:hypothetical protein